MRIRRIGGVGATVNYTLQATSAYDEADPAGTAATWTTPANMDQALTATANAATYQGGLITFALFPDVFEGVRVKVKPTYDTGAGEVPSLELWTRDSVTAAWTKRRSIPLYDPFRGVVTTKARTFSLFLANQLRNVDAVWVTMAPGAVGTPSMQWLAIQCLGHCDLTPVTPGSCEDDLTVDCIEPSACELNPFDPRCVVPTLTCADLGYEEDEDGNCIIPGPDVSFPNDPTGSTPVPRWNPPPFPTIDLCDPAAVAGFKSLLTADQLSYFEELLAGVELPCLDGPVTAPINGNTTNPLVPIIPSQPIEVYVDPTTLVHAPDPRNEDDSDIDDDEPNVFDAPSGAPLEYIGFFFSGGTPTGDGSSAPVGTAEAFFATRFTGELLTAYDDVINPQDLDNNYGNITTEPSSSNKTKLHFHFHGASAGTVVNVRIVTFGIAGSITGVPIAHYLAYGDDVDGDGIHTLRVTAINVGAGVFATQNPVAGASYFRFNRPDPLGANITTLTFDAINANYVGTGTALNWGNGHMVRIIATTPGTGGAVTVTQEYA